MSIVCHRTPLSLAVVFFAIACGGSDDATGEDTAVAQDTANSQPVAAQSAPSTPATSSAGPVTVADIDRWQRGMEAELKAVRDAGEKLKAAKTGNDSLSAIMGANDMTTRDAGAQAAGLDPQRYQFVRSVLSSAVAQLSPIEQEMNVKDMPPDMVAQMKQGREAALSRMSNDVPADVVAALRTRAAELRKQDMMLAMERLKASGAA